MRTHEKLGLGAMILGTLLAGSAGAQSAKTTVSVSGTRLVGAAALSPDTWHTVAAGTIHTSSWKDLVIDFSAEVGLFTSTLVSSKSGTRDTSTAEAQVEVRVLVDGNEAFPGVVTFGRRYQSLMAKFGGIISECTDGNGDGTLVVEDECVVTDEELQLILDTMAASSFNFMIADLSSGDHTIEVQARTSWAATSQAGSAEANASIGKVSLSVEEVRLVKDLDLSL